MKYKIINSDIFLNGKIIPEGSESELSDEQAKGIESYLLPISEPVHTMLAKEPEIKNEIKIKTKRGKK